ncbi:MAG: peptidase [Bryobacterales bacterium]|nr:peptidase [Bryobacterales bacterium]
MTRRLAVALLFTTAAFAQTFDATRYISHIKVLASPEMKGRATGSPELEKAAQYIAGQFKADKLKPVPGTKGYLQPFQVTTSAKVGKQNQLEVQFPVQLQETHGPNVTQTSTFNSKADLKPQKDFQPLNFSASGKATGLLVFAGYGITAKEYSYDDYANLDVKDKFVLVLTHEPQELDEKSVFAGKAFTDHSQLYSKAANAKAHGARGIVYLRDLQNHKADADKLDPFGRADGPAEAGILCLQITAEAATPLFAAAGKKVDDIITQIDADLKPQSFAFPGTELHANIEVERAVKTVNNVLAYLPGETNEYIIIGAHYDHLGLGDQHSLAPSLAGTVHPGADDNASGTAGVIELARYFAGRSSSGKPLKRGILFMTFAGEELGLLGSGYYATHPLLPLANAVTMINLDMVGRVREGKLFVGGAGTGTTLRPDLDSILPKHPLKVDYSDNSGYGSSDHTSFTARQVPVLFFFSGLHGDYHKPSDTWDKIDGPQSIEVLKLIAEVTEKINADTQRPTFVRVEPKADPHSGAAGPVSGSGGGYGPNFGSIPDFAEPPKGVRFADVKEGSPAALAGLKAGDILITFGDKDIANLYDFTYALRSHKPGDEVLVEVLRKDKKLAVKVTLTERK